ncbi:MAG TPA: 2-dehydropantoate 2-reductase [Oculatellaceae cyanobacterium]
MHILVMGAGGVGGYFGAVLAKVGYDVTFLARGRHLTAMESNGLKITSTKGDFHLRSVNVVESLESVGQVDVILLAVKAWQVQDCVRGLNRLKANKYMIVPLQNGVESYDEVCEIVGCERTLGGSTKIISYLERPGHIVHLGVEPEITFGEWDNCRSERVQRFADCLKQAGIKYDVPDSIQEELWKKFLFLAPCAGVGSVTQMPIGDIRSVPETRRMLSDAMKEVYELAKHHGVSLPESFVDRCMAGVETMRPDATFSMQRDFAAKKPSELHYLNGAVVRLAEPKGLPVPVNSFIYASLLPAERQARG